MSFTVTRTISLEAWSKAARQKAKVFWKSHGFTFTEDSEYLLFGRRGSILSNLTTYNPTKLLSTLTVTSLEPSTIDCAVVVDGFNQIWTEWDQACLELEMATFENYLVFGDDRAELWGRFFKSYNKAAAIWTLTGGLSGARMTEADKDNFKL